MAALESVSDNSNLCHLGVVIYFHSVWDLPDPLYSDFFNRNQNILAIILWNLDII